MNIVICDDEKQFLHSIKVKINSWAEKTGNTSGLMLHCFTSMKKIVYDAGGTIDFNIEHGKFSVEIMLGGNTSC